MFISFDQIDISVSLSSGAASKALIESIRKALAEADGSSEYTLSSNCEPSQGYLVFLSEKGAAEADDHEAYAAKLKNAAVKACGEEGVKSVNVTFVDAVVQVGFTLA